MRWTLTILVLLTATGLYSQQRESRLGELSWMVGHWAGGEGGTVSEEWWTAPAGGLMLGLHRDVDEKGSVFFEYLRIVETERGVFYVAQPVGGEATEFEMTEISGSSVLFENPEHDYPQRIRYSIDDEGLLVARIEGEIGGKRRASEWRWSPVE